MFNIKKIIIFILIVINLIILYKSNLFQIAQGNVVLADFDNYYLLTNEIKRGLNPYTAAHMITPAPPVVFIYYLPFSFLPLEYARTASTIINLFSGLFLCYLLARRYFPTDKFTLSMIFSAVYLSAFPTRFSLILGQPLLFATLLITLIMISTDNKVKALSLSLLISIKAYFALTVLTFIKKRKLIILVLAILGVLMLISFLIVKPGIQKFYIGKTFLEYTFDTTMPIGTDYYSQSFKSTLNRFGLSSFYIPAFILFILYALITTLKNKSFEKSVILSVLISPVLWQHYFTVFFPVIVYIFSKYSYNSKLLIIFLFSILFWWIEFPWIHYAQLNLFTSILASHYFLSGLGFLYLQSHSSSS